MEKGSTERASRAVDPTLKLSSMRADVFAEPKIDCHVHVLDPARFPYRADTHYAPTGRSSARGAVHGDDARTERVTRAGRPNSGYGLDNPAADRSLARGAGRYKASPWWPTTHLG
jgi:hypothetical protein